MTPGLGQAAPVPIPMTVETLLTLGGLVLALVGTYALGRRHASDCRTDPPARRDPDAELDLGERALATGESDEEYVVAVLREAGEPVSQQQVIDATGWSASKTSRVLSDLAEAGTVTKISVGRENVIKLNPHANPSASADRSEDRPLA